jgi:hypothetical protein
LCIAQSITSIKYFKRILLTSVIYKQIIIISLSNSFILIYFSLKINYLISDKSASILGETYYSIANLANDNLLFQKYLPNQPSAVMEYIITFNSTRIGLQDTLNNYTSFNSDWSICTESEILFENSIPTLIMQGSGHLITFMNIFDFISLILDQVNNI